MATYSRIRASARRRAWSPAPPFRSNGTERTFDCQGPRVRAWDPAPPAGTLRIPGSTRAVLACPSTRPDHMPRIADILRPIADRPSALNAAQGRLGRLASLPEPRRLPAYTRFLWELARDARLPAAHRALLVGGVAYLVSPIDVLPDGIPGIGEVDDAVVALALFETVVSALPADLVDEKLRASGLRREHLEADLARMRDDPRGGPRRRAQAAAPRGRRDDGRPHRRPRRGPRRPRHRPARPRDRPGGGAGLHGGRPRPPHPTSTPDDISLIHQGGSPRVKVILTADVSSSASRAR